MAKPKKAEAQVTHSEGPMIAFPQSDVMRFESMFLHQALQGPIGFPSERTVNKVKYKDLEILKVGDSVFVTIGMGAGKTYHKATAVVPYTNVATATPIQEEVDVMLGHARQILGSK